MKDDGREELITNDLFEKKPIGKMPVMVKSKYCVLS